VGGLGVLGQISPHQTGAFDRASRKKFRETVLISLSANLTMSEPMIIEPSPEEQARRRFVELTAETIKNTSSTDYPGSYPNEDHTWSVEKFKQNFRIEFHELTPADSSFSLVGIDASIANAFRRILLAEVPTMAIEHVFIQNNTSVVQDEVLASRLGLVPLKGNTQALKYMRWMKKPDQNEPLGSQATDYNILQLKLQVKCEWHPEGRERFKRGEREPKKLYINSNGNRTHPLPATLGFPF
jgi:DNA-directed RNA polymerase I and III subunit RPAC1